MRGLAAAILAICADASPLSDALDDNTPILDVLAAATPPPRAPSPYEARVFAACRKLHGLVDAHPMERALLALAPRAPGWVHVPIPWHELADPNHAGARQRKLADATKKLWRALDFDAHRHFSVLVQMHVEQVRAAFAKRADGWVPDFARVFVFDTRLTALGSTLTFRGAELPGAALGRVPVPLLGHALDDDGDVARAAGSSLFWAGGCHARVRCFLEGLGPGVRPCGDTIDAAAFRAGLRDAAWALAPRGTMHATFMLAAAVRHGALPVYVGDDTPACVSRATCCDRVFRLRRSRDAAAFLPYGDLGLAWRDLGLVVDAADAAAIPAMVANASDLAGRRRRLDVAQALFSHRGVAAYVAWKLGRER